MNEQNIKALSKEIYKTNVMPSGDSKSFIGLSKKLILNLQNGVESDKIERILSSELIATYGLSVSEEEVTEIADIKVIIQLGLGCHETIHHASQGRKLAISWLLWVSKLMFNPIPTMA